MMYAYDELYLEKAQVALGTMLDYAVHCAGIPLQRFYDMFLMSSISRRFSKGEPSIVVGRSGIELVYEVTAQTSGLEISDCDMDLPFERTPEYWTGFSVAYYQWESGLSFQKINDFVSIDTIIDLYHPYHEMDIRQFCDKMNEIRSRRHLETYLKKYRQMMGYSQRELAERTDIPLKTIQQYEQRQKDINRASVDYVVRLSKALFCTVEDLLE